MRWPLLGIFFFFFGEITLKSLAANYPEHPKNLKRGMKTVENNIVGGNDVQNYESRTEYDIRVFMKMMAQKKKMIPTRAAMVLFY